MRAMNGFRYLVIAALLASCASADRAERPRSTREVVTGAARIRGGGFRMDVQVGRGLLDRPGVAGAKALAPHATVAR